LVCIALEIFFPEIVLLQGQPTQEFSNKNNEIELARISSPPL
jgi:hypothetical protein